MGFLKERFRGAVAVLALVSAGCGGSQTKPSEPPPPQNPAPAEPAAAPAPAASEGPRALKHESMQSVTEEISAAVQAGLSGQPLDFALIGGDAQKIQDGADGILDDAPATLRDEDRVRYEGLKARLKERAAALRTAADAKDKNGSNRSYLQLQQSCNQCHNQFGPSAEGK